MEGRLGTENIPLTGSVGARAITFQVSLGEKLRFTQNDTRKGYTNGDVGIVTKIQTMGEEILFLELRRVDGTTVRVDLKDYSDKHERPFFVPAYAQTIYSSQGQTVEGKVFVLNDSGIERSNAYVALSRHRSECHLYVSKDQFQTAQPLTNDAVVTHLAKQYSEDRYNQLAFERIGQTNRKEQALPHEMLSKQLEIALV